MEISEEAKEIICKNLKLSYEEIMEMSDEELIKHVEKITGKKVMVNFKAPQEADDSLSYEKE